MLAVLAATLSLNTILFLYQTKGPVKDLYNMQDNPQLSFVTNASEATEVFVLLSRHITDAKDFCDNKEFITVHIYRGGQRIFYPEDAFLSGTKINRWEFF